MNGASSTAVIALVLGVVFAAAGWLGGRGSGGPTDWGQIDWSDEIRTTAIGYETKTVRLTSPLRWAPELCSAPPPNNPRFSEARAGSEHGRKLYHLFTDNRQAYWDATHHKDNGELFALVKVSHTPVPVIDNASQFLIELLEDLDGPGLAYSPIDGKPYTPGAITSLFIMQRVGDADTPRTDQGWIYGVTSPDGREVIQSGLIESCMSCHAKARHGRLFGLRPTNRPDLYQPPGPLREVFLPNE